MLPVIKNLKDLIGFRPLALRISKLSLSKKPIRSLQDASRNKNIKDLIGFLSRLLSVFQNLQFIQQSLQVMH